MSEITKKQRAPKIKRAGQPQANAQTPPPPPVSEHIDSAAASSCSPVDTSEEQEQQGQTAPEGKLPTQAEIDAQFLEIAKELIKKHAATWKELAKY